MGHQRHLLPAPKVVENKGGVRDHQRGRALRLSVLLMVVENPRDKQTPHIQDQDSLSRLHQRPVVEEAPLLYLQVATLWKGDAKKSKEGTFSLISRISLQVKP